MIGAAPPPPTPTAPPSSSPTTSSPSTTAKYPSAAASASPSSATSRPNSQETPSMQPSSAACPVNYTSQLKYSFFEHYHSNNGWYMQYLNPSQNLLMECKGKVIVIKPRVPISFGRTTIDGLKCKWVAYWNMVCR